MNERPWWSHAIQGGIVAVTVALIFGWLSKIRLKPRPESERGQLRHHRVVLIAGIIGPIFFGSMAVYLQIGATSRATWAVTVFFLAFAVLTGFMVLEYKRGRHSFSPEGLDFGKLFGPRGFLRWNDVGSVRFVPSMSWIRLESQSGAVARLSLLLLGLPDFAQCVLEQAPHGSIDEMTLKLLKSLASRRPPVKVA